MGNAHASFRLGTAPLEGIVPLLGMKLVEIQHAFIRFDELSRLPGVNLNTFAAVFPSAKDPAAAFAVFDVMARGKIDILEVFAALSLCSNASANERKKFTFQFYDFDGSRSITIDELVIMIRSVLVGVAKLTDGTAPSLRECEALSKSVFEEADSVKDSKITYVEFSDWVRRSRHAKGLLSCFNRRGELKAHHGLPSSARRDAESGAGTGTGAGTGAGGGAGAGGGGDSMSVGSMSVAQGSVVDGDSKKSAASRRSHRSGLRKRAAPRDTAGTVPLPAKTKTRARGTPKQRRAGSGVKYAKSEILTLKKLFDKMDSDGSGNVDVKEFRLSLTDRMLSHMRGMFKVMDKDKSGTITFEELLRELYPYASDTEFREMMAWVTVTKKKPTSMPSFRLTEPQIEEMRALFDHYDLNRSGTIDMDEMFNAMGATGVFTTEEIRETFASADVDRNTRLSFSEFKQFYKDVFGMQEMARRHKKK